MTVLSILRGINDFWSTIDSIFLESNLANLIGQSWFQIGLHLRQLVAADRKRRKPAERWWLDDGHGNPAYASAWALTQVFRRRCAELGIVGPKPLHGIRAAGITKMLLESGGRAELVANVAGHSVAVMLKHYAMITSDDTKGVVDLLWMYTGCIGKNDVKSLHVITIYH